MIGLPPMPLTHEVTYHSFATNIANLDSMSPSLRWLGFLFFCVDSRNEMKLRNIKHEDQTLTAMKTGGYGMARPFETGQKRSQCETPQKRISHPKTIKVNPLMLLWKPTETPPNRFAARGLHSICSLRPRSSIQDQKDLKQDFVIYKTR